VGSGGAIGFAATGAAGVAGGDAEATGLAAVSLRTGSAFATVGFASTGLGATATGLLIASTFAGAASFAAGASGTALVGCGAGLDSRLIVAGFPEGDPGFFGGDVPAIRRS
jgi:hypothetical protein